MKIINTFILYTPIHDYVIRDTKSNAVFVADG